MKKLIFILYLIFPIMLFSQDYSFYLGGGPEISIDFGNGYTKSVFIAPVIFGSHGVFDNEKDLYFRGSVFFPKKTKISFSSYTYDDIVLDFSNGFGFSVSLGNRTIKKAPNNRKQFLVVGFFASGLYAKVDEPLGIDIDINYSSTNIGGNIIFDFIFFENTKSYAGISFDIKIGVISSTPNGAYFLLNPRPSVFLFTGIK
jgi:hypothetical protein